MKLRGHRVELVQEFAKDLTYEQRFKTLDNQLYIFAKQWHRIYRLKDHVEWVVTDSPILLGLMYTPDGYPASFRQLVLDFWSMTENYNFFIGRVKEYQTYGRSQSAEQAGEIDSKCYDFLINNKIPFEIVNGDAKAAKSILTSLQLY